MHEVNPSVPVRYKWHRTLGGNLIFIKNTKATLKNILMAKVFIDICRKRHA